MKAKLTLILLLVSQFDTCAEPTITADQAEYRPQQDIVISWKNNETGSANDWIGIYPQGKIPGEIASTTWAYLNNTRQAPTETIAAGSITFTNLDLPEGTWIAFLLQDGGYKLGALPIQFTVVDPRPRIERFHADHVLADGSPITLSWSLLNENNLTRLILLDGQNHPIDLRGQSSIEVTPPRSVDTTYTLVANDGESSQSLTVEGVRIGFFEAEQQFVDGSPLTLSWFLNDAGGLMEASSLTLSDGASPPRDVLGLTSLEVSPSENTDYLLNLNDGQHLARLRLFRDSGNTIPFSVSTTTPTNQEELSVRWNTVTGGPADWIGIFAAGSTPGPQPSVAWTYLNGTQSAGGNHGSGEFTFPALSSGDYYVALFLNDGYEIAQGPIRIQVVDPPPPPPELLSFVVNGDEITMTWKSDPNLLFTYVLLESDDLSHFQAMPDHGFIFSSEGSSTTYTFTRPANHGERHYYRVAIE